MPKVALIYLGYGMSKYLNDVVDAVAQLTYPKEDLGLILLPAGSPDGVGQQMKEQVLPRQGQDLPACVLLDDGQNRGFAGNNNLGIKYALDHGYDYIFLHNGDLKLGRDSITEMVKLVEADANIGSVQCVIRYWHEPDKLNVTGGSVHVAGYGFATDNGRLLSEVALTDGQEIAYASGAAVLYRASALRKVGLLEEGFFMYHEDLELGMRLRFAGYKNVLASQSFAYHDYKFGRNQKMFAWIELYRNVVIWSYYRIGTLLLLLPLLCAIELGTWLMAAKGGWFKAKLWAASQWFMPRTWRLLKYMRQRAQSLRAIKDADFLRLVTGKIEHQETSSWFLDKLVNPVVDVYFQAVRRVIKW
jgi:GT2 family glycosyltransferase